MFKILIDTSERKNKKIAIYSDGLQEIARVEGDFDIVSKIKEELTNLKISENDIETIDFIRGPGSFTGLKIGSAIANVYNWSKGKITPDQAVMPAYGSEPNIQQNKW